MKSYINKPVDGQVRIDIKPCNKVTKARKKVHDYLAKSVLKNRIAGYDDKWIKSGRIVVYYNPLVNPTGSAATTAAKEILEIIEKDNED